MVTRKAQLDDHNSYNLSLPDIKGGGEGRKEIDSKSKRLQREVKSSLCIHNNLMTTLELMEACQDWHKISNVILLLSSGSHHK